MAGQGILFDALTVGLANCSSLERTACQQKTTEKNPPMNQISLARANAAKRGRVTHPRQHGERPAHKGLIRRERRKSPPRHLPPPPNPNQREPCSSEEEAEGEVRPLTSKDDRDRRRLTELTISEAAASNERERCPELSEGCNRRKRARPRV